MQFLHAIASLAWQLASAPFCAVSTALAPYPGSALVPFGGGGALVAGGAAGAAMPPLCAILLVVSLLLLLCCRGQKEKHADDGLVMDLQVKEFEQHKEKVVSQKSILMAEVEELNKEIAELEETFKSLDEEYEAEDRKRKEFLQNYPQPDWYALDHQGKLSSDFSAIIDKLNLITTQKQSCIDQEDEKMKRKAYKLDKIELLKEEIDCCSNFIVLVNSRAPLEDKERSLKHSRDFLQANRDNMDKLKIA